jgi:hypothetical protein
MYSSGASQLLLLPVVAMHLLFLHGGSFAAPLVFHSSNATGAQDDHAVLDIAPPTSQIFISDMVVPHHTAPSSSTLQSIIQAGARYIQPLFSYLQGLMGAPPEMMVVDESRRSASTIRSRLRGLKKVDLV